MPRAGKKTGELTHRFFRGRAGGPGFLDDYALPGEAFIGIFNSTGDGIRLTRARVVAAAMLRRFTPSNGSLTISWDRSALPVAMPSRGDSVKPSGRPAAVGLLFNLAALSNDARYSRAALKALKPLAHLVSARPARWAALMSRLQRTRLRSALKTALKEKNFAEEKNFLSQRHMCGQWQGGLS